MAATPTENADAASSSPSPKTSTERPRSKSYSGIGHKKSPSGNILSRLPFFRTSLDVPTPIALSPSTSPTSEDVIPFPDVTEPDEDLPQSRGSAMASAMEAQAKGRKRKGSLRKTALLGTGKLRLDRNSSGLDVIKPRSPTKLFFGGSRKTSRASQTEAEIKDDAIPIATSPPAEPAAKPQGLKLRTQVSKSGSLLSSLTSPIGAYGSTTDDDDRFTIPSTLGSLSVPLSKPSPSPSPPSSESSVTNLPLISVRRASNKANSTSPLSVPSPLDPSEDWDYSATEWWGWIILLVTWIVFVVGMGSCLEVWSWAWDVGETPYAPPELEDDPTLPIVGYYPALMVLTAVMSWVWVVVAWMGMKYFKHAKIQGEGT